MGNQIRRSARLNNIKLSESANFMEYVNLTDTLMNNASQQDKFQKASKDLDDDMGDVEVINLVSENLGYGSDSDDSDLENYKEDINLASTEFPKPPPVNFEHVHHVPEEIDENEVIALAMESIRNLIDDISLEVKPDSRTEMMNGDRKEEFIEAEHKELYEIHQNGTFIIKICPSNRTPITCRWVYDIKRKDNVIIRFKARLVVQGFKQKEGIDFQKTFSSVAQIRTFRVIMALAIRFGLTVTQYDVASAFLAAELDVELFMTFPPGYPSKTGDRNEVWKLLKALYGLKQAGRLWNKLLMKVFAKANLHICKTDSGVLHLKSDTLCLINVHVDDYAIACKDEAIRVKIENVMSNIFTITPMGVISEYLGINVVWSKLPDGRRTVKLHQGPYHERTLLKTGYSRAKPAKTPSQPSVKLSILDSPLEDDEKPTWPYMSVTGSLMYMYSSMGTRPDLCPRTIKLSSYNNNPGKKHVDAQKYLLRYLRGTTHRGIHYTEPEECIEDFVEIIAFVDSDWAGCPDTRRSTCGYVVTLCGGPVAWKSQRKRTLALSSCEAEFMALTDVAREILWLCNFLDEIGIKYYIPRIYCDSRSAICWAEDPVQHQRNKHVELKYYYIRDAVQRQLVEIWKINTTHNVADIMTKDTTVKMGDDLLPPLMGERKPILEE